MDGADAEYVYLVPKQRKEMMCMECIVLIPVLGMFW